MLLIAASTLTEEDHVVKLVLDIPQTLLLGKAHQVIADLFCVSGTVGVGTQLFKKAKFST